MNQEVLALWPELEWIQDEDLREATAKTWELALERSPLTAEDLNHHPLHSAGAGPEGHLHGPQALRGARGPGLRRADEQVLHR